MTSAGFVRHLIYKLKTEFGQANSFVQQVYNLSDSFSADKCARNRYCGEGAQNQNWEAVLSRLITRFPISPVVPPPPQVTACINFV